MHIAIIGTGAMACLFSARLNQLAEVTLIGSWQAQIDALTQNGLTVQELDGTVSQHTVQASADPDQVAQADVVLILTKSTQTADAVARAEAVLAPFGAALTLQNGLGNLEQLQEAFGDDRAVAASTTSGALLVEPCVIRHTGQGMIRLAQATPQIKHTGAIISYLRAAGFTLELTQSADSLLWGKACVSAGINPITALLRQPNGFLVEDASAHKIMLAAAREAQAVATALGIELPYADAGARSLAVAEVTATNRSSMLQDVERGRPTEIDAICGAISRAGQAINIPTPLNSVLYQKVIELEQNPTDLFDITPLFALI